MSVFEWFIAFERSLVVCSKRSQLNLAFESSPEAYMIFL